MEEQIWVDAQLPPSLARWLRSQHTVDALHVQDLGLLHARDAEIFEAARTAPQPVVIVSKDDDFMKILNQRGPPPQLVWLRCGNVTNAELRRIVLEAWPRTLRLLTAGEGIVEIRRRAEPGG